MADNAATPARPTLVEEVTATLRDLILRGRYAVGDFLPSEGNLAKEIGVSRTVIREAMRNLQAQGLVEISQGRRPRVKAVDPEAVITSLDVLLQRSEATILHLIQVRRPLEGECAALAARYASDEDLAGLGQAISELRMAEDLESCVQADVAFHRRMAQASGNPIFVLLLDAVRGLLVRAQQTLFPLAGLVVTIEGHRRVLDCVQQRDSKAAREAMIRHLDEAEEALRRAYEKTPPNGPHGQSNGSQGPLSGSHGSGGRAASSFSADASSSF